VFDNEGWRVYGAPWLQPVAISSKSDQRKPQEHAKSVAVGCERLLKGAHGKGRVDATSLLLKRGSASWLRKREASPANPKAHMTKKDVNASARGRPSPRGSRRVHRMRASEGPVTGTGLGGICYSRARVNSQKADAIGDAEDAA
jgi:hypothetical protein